MAFSPDGRYLAAGQDLATAFLWAPVRVIDVASGQTRFELLYPTQLVPLSSGLAPDGAICLARKTDWIDAGNDRWFGLGQRLFATDVAEHAIMSVRTIELDDAPATAEVAGEASG